MNLFFQELFANSWMCTTKNPL